MTKRTLTVAVTGHRPNRLRIGQDALTSECRRVLAGLYAGARDASRVAMSPLAEGADRAFAEAALDEGFDLVALLPFERTDYEKTFENSAASNGNYRRLLARASRVVELPGSLDASKDAYAAVGAESVRRCDILVAVWDGAPAAGKGGTPEIIDMAIAAGKPVIWVDAAGQSSVRLLSSAIARPERTVASLDTAIAEAVAVDRSGLMALATALITPMSSDLSG